MKIHRDLNEFNSVKTRKVNGKYVTCIYSDNNISNELGVSITGVGDKDNVWLDIRCSKEFARKVREYIKNNNFGQDFMSRKVMLLKGKKSPLKNCSYCGEKHNFESEYKILKLYDSRSRKGDSVTIFGECIYNLLECLEDIPEDLISYKTLSEI